MSRHVRVSHLLVSFLYWVFITSLNAQTAMCAAWKPTATPMWRLATSGGGPFHTSNGLKLYNALQCQIDGIKLSINQIKHQTAATIG